MSDQLTPNPVAAAAQRAAERQPLSLAEGLALLRDRRDAAGDTGARPDPARTDAPKGNPYSDAGRKLNEAKKAKTVKNDDSAAPDVQDTSDTEDAGAAVDEPADDAGDDAASDESPDVTGTRDPGEPAEGQTIDLGHGVKVSLDEIRDGFMMKADHTRKTQSLAQERTRFENDRQQRLGLLDMLLDAQAQTIGRPKSLRQHLEADPANGNMNYAVQQERLEQLAMAKQVRAREQAHDAAQRMGATIKALAQTHGEKAPAHYYGAVNIAAQMMGVPAQHLALQMTHPAVADIVYDARRWRDLQASKGSIVRKIADKPKVMRPGVRVSPQAARDRQAQSAHAKLKSSGNLADAVALLRTLRGKGRVG